MDILTVNNFFLDANDSIKNFNCYNINKSVKILNYVLTNDGYDKFKLWVKKDINLTNIIDTINLSLKYISSCKSDLTSFYEKLSGSSVYSNWFDDIEVYSIDLTFISDTDYEAIISCGDTLIPDHLLEIYIDNNKITDIILDG
ncbi:hypothetical protein [uncultured Clostridium sp.]|uniref:hypothetical protein n=1 Tax=uncultured Clostridium sp. TaxID=59620 RepID=UPI0025EEFC89|nr:hypothetical protein [uncultured Clostridium sp.]